MSYQSFFLFLEAEGLAFARAAADEGGGNAVVEQAGSLLLDDGEVEGTVQVERGVGGGDKAGEFGLFCHGNEVNGIESER